MFPVIINSNLKVAPDAYVLSFARSFEFQPGQVIGLSFGEADQPRLYSIASGNHEDVVRILYKVNPLGQFTPGLSRLKPGDTIFSTSPFGQFLGDNQPAVWVATGTGIAPFASMFFSGLACKKILIQGNRFVSGLYFKDQIQQSMGNRYIPTCTRERIDGIFFGRVQNFLEEWQELDISVKYYLCGSSEMVVGVRDLLIAKGVPFERVVAEIFF